MTELWRKLCIECRAVGLAEGAQLEAGAIEKTIATYRDGPSDSINAKHGIATPLNKAIVALPEAVQPAH